MESAQLKDRLPESALHQNHEQQYVGFEVQHRLLPSQPPSSIYQSEAQEAYHYSSVSQPASSGSGVISSLHSGDQEHTGSRKVSSLQESSAAHISGSEALHKQRTSRIKNWSRYLPAVSRVVNRWWLLEMLSCLVALTSLAATVAILAIYNNRPLPHWPYSITVNSLISLFVTIAKAALLLPIAEGISQLKWLWFRHPHYLNDFNTFDLASRGPWGACQLLFTLRGLHMASLGSLLTIAALAIDPFTQQVVQYTTRNVPILYMNASLPKSHNLNSGSSTRVPLSDPDSSLQAAIYGSLYNPSGAPLAITPTCLTGNCTFTVENGGAFSTLGVCSQCAEITEHIKTVCLNHTVPHSRPGISDTSLQCDHTLPNGQRLMIPIADTTFTSSYALMVANSTLGSVNGSLALPEIGTAFSNFAMLSHVSRNCTIGPTLSAMKSTCPFLRLTPFAVECALSFCVQSYTASVENNVLSEHVVSQFSKRPLFALGGDSGTYVLVPESCVVNGKSQNLASLFGNYPNDTEYLRLVTLGNGPVTYVLRDCVYAVQYRSRQHITDYLESYLNGTVYGYEWSEIDFQPETMQSLYNSGNATLESVRNTFANLATSMSNSIRQSGGELAQGLTYKNEVYIHVRWAWLTLPITLVLLSIIFLAITIIQSANVDIWKSSSLALLYHGLQDGQHHDAVDSIQQMEELAKDHRVTLGRSASHGNFKLI